MIWPLAAIIAAMLVTVSPAQIDHAIDAGRIDQARLMIARAIEEGADPASLEPSLARIAYKSGAFAEALARGEAMLTASRDDAGINEMVGLSALALGDDFTGADGACKGHSVTNTIMAGVERAWCAR